MKENRYIKVKADCILPKAFIFNTEERLLQAKSFRFCGESYNFTVPDSIISLNENFIGNLSATNTLDVQLYNQIGDLITPSSYTFSGGIFSMIINPEIVPCLPSPIYIDGNYVDDLPNTDPLGIKVVDQNDVPITPISGTFSGGVATVKIPTALEILIPYKILDGSASIVVVTGSNGTIATIDSTGLFAFTIAVNSTPVTVPFALAVGDVVGFTFTASTIDGNIKLNGYA